MRAHLMQFDVAWEDRDENFRRVDELLDRTDIQSGDLVVLPELFDGGFSLNTSLTADTTGLTASYLQRLADDLDCTVQGARTVFACGVQSSACPLARNEAIVFEPGGACVARYHKVHPFTFGREPEAFEGGNDLAIYAWKQADESLTVCPAICYDLRFPELFRLGLKKGAEVFAIGANWPSTRQSHWRSLLIARAIENQAYVLGVNRTGDDPHLNYVGGSIAIDPKGEILGELRDEVAVLTVDIDPAELRDWREKFPAWRDLRLI